MFDKKNRNASSEWYEDNEEDEMDDDEMGEMPMFPFDAPDLVDDSEDLGGTYPIIALRNTVLFPGFIAPISISREKSVKALQAAAADKKLVAIFAQKDSDTDEPAADDLHKTGTLARVLKIFKMPDGATTAVLQGQRRTRLESLTSETPYLAGVVQDLPDILATDKMRMEALVESIRGKAQNIIKISPDLPDEAAEMLDNMESQFLLLNFIAANLNVETSKKQAILEIDDVLLRADRIFAQLQHELLLAELKADIESKTQVELDKQQREYFLGQQLKTIQDEMGEASPQQDNDELAAKARTKKWSAAVQDQFDKELRKLRRMNTMQPDYGMQLSYLETVLALPWGKYTIDDFDLKRAKATLDKEHFGLTQIKERILEHLAILKLKGDLNAPIICLVGPPGVGKTSLGQSVANALKRNYQRIAFGGLHDESEIRGHRRTYMGAMPGRIIQALRKADSDNPVIILDEIDKIGRDYRGDPQNALLEVLDPAQNHTFHDNFLDIDYDLSKVLFIATANSLDNIQPALLDRMEVIHLSGYTTEEKLEIVKKHLLTNQLAAHGLKPAHLKLSTAVVTSIIRHYTREAGVRDIDRRIAALCRATAKRVASEEAYTPKITYADAIKILGPEVYDEEFYSEVFSPGVAVGLAWTQVGGEILYIETLLSKGKGSFTLTGNLGEVMKESASTALSYLKAYADDWGIDSARFDDTNIHIHIPEGGIPKDGPSAGITMLTALASAFTRRPLRPHLAMTGEITLRGKVLPVGGIKEKILAAKRAGIRQIILCKANERHILDIPADYLTGLTFRYATTMHEVIDWALMPEKH